MIYQLKATGNDQADKTQEHHSSEQQAPLGSENRSWKLSQQSRTNEAEFKDESIQISTILLTGLKNKGQKNFPLIN